jgi:hypothetical protein
MNVTTEEFGWVTIKFMLLLLLMIAGFFVLVKVAGWNILG